MPIALIVLTNDASRGAEDVVRECVSRVREQVGPVAAFKQAAVLEQLPKTRSGKTLRGLIQAIADGRQAQYTVPGTIEDAGAIAVVERALLSIDYPRGGGA